MDCHSRPYQGPHTAGTRAKGPLFWVTVGKFASADRRLKQADQDPAFSLPRGSLPPSPPVTLFWAGDMGLSHLFFRGFEPSPQRTPSIALPCLAARLPRRTRDRACNYIK